jgi:hypothetical protein
MSPSPLYPLAVDLMHYAAQIYHDFTDAVKRVPGDPVSIFL